MATTQVHSDPASGSSESGRHQPPQASLEATAGPWSRGRRSADAVDQLRRDVDRTNLDIDRALKTLRSASPGASIGLSLGIAAHALLPTIHAAMNARTAGLIGMALGAALGRLLLPPVCWCGFLIRMVYIQLAERVNWITASQAAQMRRELNSRFLLG